MPQICLGTAQFGMAYGITNNVGKVSEASLAPLLSHADKAGISFLDTAQAYGDSESVLGRQLPAHHGFKIISKLPGQTKSEFGPKRCRLLGRVLLLQLSFAWCPRFRCFFTSFIRRSSQAWCSLFRGMVA